MANGASRWFDKVNEDGSFSVLARVTALSGSGDEILPGEGNCLTQADVSTITCRIYDLGIDRDSTTGTEVTPAPTLTPAANIYDTLRVTGWPTGRERAGYNFRHDVSATFPSKPGTGNVGNYYRLEYCFTLTGGSVIWLVVTVRTVYIIQS